MLRFSPLFPLLLAACDAPASDTAPQDDTHAPIDTDPEDTGSVDDTGGAGGWVEPPLPDMPELYAALDANDKISLISTYLSADGVTILELSVRQPIDHEDPGGATFEQWVTVRYRSATAPTVLVVTGYENWIGSYEDMLSRMLEANQVSIEKRYMGISMPEGSIDWTTMSIAQVAGDAHAVVEALRPIMSGPWVGTGGSQGGTDSLHHRRLYPDDLVGTVALSAPIVHSLQDPRSLSFFETEVDPECQDKLEVIQRAALTPEADGGVREAVVELVETWYPEYTYERVGGVDVALEMYLIELPFGFWQYYYAGYCDYLYTPEEDPSLAAESALWAYAAEASDQSLESMGTYWYQIAHETGYPAMSVEGIEHLLDPDRKYIYEFLPEGAETPSFESGGEALQAWLETDADNVMFIYGAYDPWRAFGPDLSEVTGNVELFLAPTASHNAYPNTLTPADQDLFVAELESWVQ